MQDDLYPSDGTYYNFDEPVEQKIARKKKQAQTLEAMPVLLELVERLTARIDFYGSVDAMPAAAKADPQKFVIVHNANEMTRDSLRAELEYIQGLIDTYKR